jgi:1-acyl-sn-glycerol-3-phosphate acyltransferase
MNLAYWTVNNTIKNITSVLCRIEAGSLEKVPAKGPLILVCNHINFIEVPLIYTHLQPRPVTGFAKAETWDSPLLGPLFNLWGAIPIRRGEADTAAMRHALNALAQNRIVAVAPEGTRSGDGKLRKGQPGIVTLALHSDAPLLPLVYYGNEVFPHNIRRLRRTDFHIRVGRPFQVVTHGQAVTKAIRQHITDEIMYLLAALLPPDYRGEYADLNQASQDYIQFI